jgi:hypothetical protein
MHSLLYAQHPCSVNPEVAQRAWRRPWNTEQHAVLFQSEFSLLLLILSHPFRAPEGWTHQDSNDGRNFGAPALGSSPTPTLSSTSQSLHPLLRFTPSNLQSRATPTFHVLEGPGAHPGSGSSKTTWSVQRCIQQEHQCQGTKGRW